jgi:hypothetical protein
MFPGRAAPGYAASSALPTSAFLRTRPRGRSGRHFPGDGRETEWTLPRCGETKRGELAMLNNEAEPLVIAFKREVAKMRDRDASDLEIQAMLEFVEQSIRWREELNNREPLVCALREAAGLPH